MTLSPDDIHGWVAARSIARDLPAPVLDHGGWRVDTASATERCRYIFAEPSPVIAALARGITTPGVFLKLCATDTELAALLPTGWAIEGQTWMMAGGPTAAPPLDAAYRLERSGDAHRAMVTIRARDGSVAASGHAASAHGVFAYDRIVTHDDHRRRGLGRVVMAALGDYAPEGATHILAATAMGRALYETIGWRVRSDYTTAFIPVQAPVERGVMPRSAGPNASGSSSDRR